MYRNIALDEYYHICNRENDKKEIFKEERDWIRFLFTVLYFQSPVTFEHAGRQVTHYVKHRRFAVPMEDINSIINKRCVELTTFTLMPNHFHLVTRELREGGIASYLSRIQNAYTKYFNTKYQKTGHLFQGPYRAVHLETNAQLLHLSAYIHKNPRELTGWRDKEHLFPWSSYQDYLSNRWGQLLKPAIVLEQFDTSKEYKEFVKTSSAKEDYLDKYLEF